MTLKEAKSYANLLGYSINKTQDGDYRYNVLGGKEETAGYTDNLEDAIGSIQLQHNEQPEFRKGA
jgi:hypothetical protein